MTLRVEGEERGLLTIGEEAGASSETPHTDSGSSKDFLKYQRPCFVPERAVV